VIFLTTAVESEARGRELGAVGYLRKPVRSDALLSFIAEKVQGGLLPLR
jgi:CheY-like chemotaxis protein